MHNATVKVLQIPVNLVSNNYQIIQLGEHIIPKLGACLSCAFIWGRWSKILFIMYVRSEI